MPANRVITERATEAEFQSAVIQAARLFRWFVHHSRPAPRPSGDGWATPIQGDKGFPDLTMARKGRIIFAELKSEKGTVAVAQAQWLDALGYQDVGVESRQAVNPDRNPEVYVWRPSDMAEIVEILR